MSISSISGTNAAAYISASSGTSETDLLEKQLTKLKADLEKVDSSKDSDKAKEAKKKQIEQQIKTLEAQIAEKSKNSSSESAAAQQAPPPPPPGGKPLTAASPAEIGSATTNSEGRFDIRI
ncbi:FlxA-like family protein [Paenibacillus sp. sgz500958]|uniref:FlxA-like family protein n=1 Tax=Paenibacillus sp. sgz500958 TaxID=3242475 RepID=UPI0036D2E58B